MITKTKADIAALIAEDHDITKAKATVIVDGVLDHVAGALRRGDEVKLHGFGSFSVARRQAKEGRNPRTGEPVTIAARKAPRFKPAKALHAAVNA